MLRKKLEDTLERKAQSMDGPGRIQLQNKCTSIRNLDNPWVAFKRLLSDLGKTTYRETIREALRPSETVDIPLAYNLLWQLPVQGILSLNLDRLAVRSHSQLFPGVDLKEFVGNQIQNAFHVLNGQHHFIGNLHGTSDNFKSWVFTIDDLKTLLADEGYRRFVSTCLLSRTVLFIGVSTDDIAVGSHLASIITSGIDMLPHYWITNRLDSKSDQWAEKYGLRMIRYRSTNADHSELVDLLTDLTRAVPEPERPAPPVVLEVTNVPATNPLASPKDLAGHSANELRYLLNEEACRLLAVESEEAQQRYLLFTKQYAEVIYRAWYTSIDDGCLLYTSRCV